MATEVRTKRIDADTHFNLSVDYKELKGLLPRARSRELEDIMWRDAWRIADSEGVQAELTGAPAAAGRESDPEWDPESRIVEMDRLGFDMQVLNTQRAMPAPLHAVVAKPLWLRTALAQLYNNAAAALQERYADRFICQATFPWDDIEASVKEVERASALGFRAVSICGSWMDQNLDAYELYPFWEAVSGCDMACIVHNFTQGHRGSMTEHITPYPMVGTERYHRLHIGTYVGFGLDYAVACCALTLGGVLEEFPNLRFLFFEAGASWMAHAMHGADRSFYIERACSRSDALPSELIKRHCMTAIESLEPVEQLVAAYGADNYVIGTDFPHPEFQRLPNAPSDITGKQGLSVEDQNKILGGNLARALKL